MSTTGSVQERIQSYVNTHPNYQGKPLSEISAELIAAGVLTAEELQTLDKTSTFTIARTGDVETGMDSFEHSEEEELNAPVLDGERSFRRTNSKTGEAEIVTITYFEGKPSKKRVANMSGELVAEYSYSKAVLANGQEVTTIVKVPADGSKVEQTIALDIDENGDYSDENFVARTTTYTADIVLPNGIKVKAGSKQVMSVKDGNLEEILCDESAGTGVITTYNGKSISEYDENALHRLYQQTVNNGEIHEVRYDGKGNTYAVIMKNDGFESVKTYFNREVRRNGLDDSHLIRANDLGRLNPTYKPDGLGSGYILVPGEYDANSSILLNRGTIEEMEQGVQREMFEQAGKRIYSSSIGEYTLPRKYNSYEELAREMLKTQGVSNPTNKQVNDRANELILLNGQAQLTKGAKIKVVSAQSSSAQVGALKTAGFKQTPENNPFYAKFNALDENQKARVLSIIRSYGKNADLNMVKAAVFEMTGINLYDTSLTVNENRQGSFNAGFYNSSMPLEYFITNRLGLDLNSDRGRQVYERMRRLPQSQLNNLSASDFAPASANQFPSNRKISISPEAGVQDIVATFGNLGVDLRTESEIRTEQASPRYRARRQKEEAISLLYNSVRAAYDAIDAQISNLKSNMLQNVGTILLEDIKHYAVPQAVKDLMNLTGIKNGTVDGLIKSVFDKRAELQEMLVKIENLRTSSNFERDYKALTGHDYNPNDIQALMDLRSNFAGTTSPVLNLRVPKSEKEISDFQNESNKLLLKILGNDEVEDVQDFIASSSFGGNIIEMALMVYMTAGMGEVAFIKNAGTAVEAFTGSRVLGTGVKSAMVLGGYTAGRESLNIIDDAVNANSWSEFGDAALNRGEQVLTHSTQSALFGFVAGATAEKLFNWSKASQNFVSSQFSKLFGDGGSVVLSEEAASAVPKVFTPSAQAVSVAEKALSNGSILTGSELVSKVAASTQGLNYVGKAVNFILEAATFAGWEITEQTAVGIAKEVFSDESEFNKAVSEGRLEEYLKEKIKSAPDNLWEAFKGQGENLIMLKIVSFAIGAHSAAGLQGKYESLDSSKTYVTEVNGEQKVVVETANGRVVCNSVSDALTVLNQLMTLESIVKFAPKSEANPAGSRVSGQNGSVPPEYASLPEYTRDNRPANTTIMSSENLIISSVTGRPVGRLVEKPVEVPEHMRTGLSAEQAEILSGRGASIEDITRDLNTGVIRPSSENHLTVGTTPTVAEPVQPSQYRPIPVSNVPTPMEVFELGKILTPEEIKLTSSDLVDASQGKKQLTPQGEEIVMRMAKQIHTIASNRETDVVNMIRSMGLDVGADFTFRSKSIQSLHDKLQNALFEGDGISVEKALDDVRDSEGVRTIYESQDFTQHPDVRALLERGDREGAIRKASELQSNATFEALKRYIDSVAEGTNELEITRISNYMGKDGIPYFSESQLSALKAYAESKGVRIPIVERVSVVEEADGARTEVVNPKSTTKVRGSGYTALQMNFRTKDGFILEGQFRGGKVNVFAEAEHVPYDIRTGKDIVGNHPELAEIYKPIIELLKGEHKISDSEFAEHTAYLNAHYEYLRLTELGFEDGTNPPKFPEGLDARLRAENLELLHEYVEKIKKEPQRAQELQAEYESKLVQNTPENTTSVKYNTVEPAVEVPAAAKQVSTDEARQILSEQKNPDGTTRFNEKSLKFVLKAMKGNVQLGMELLDMKNPDGSYRLDPFELNSIMSLVKENPELVMSLLNMKNPNGSYRLDTRYISDVYEAVKDDVSTGKELFEMKNSNGSNRFEDYDIYDLMKLKSENPELFDYVVNMKNPDGSYRFPSTSIDFMFNFLAEDVALGKSILELKDAEGNFLVQDYEVGLVKNLLNQFNNKEFAISLLKEADGAGNRRFDLHSNSLSSMLNYQNDQPQVFAELMELLKAKTADGKYKYSRDMVFKLYDEYRLGYGNYETLKSRYDAISDYMHANNLPTEYNVIESTTQKGGLFVSYSANDFEGKILFDENNNFVTRRTSQSHPEGREEVLEVDGTVSETAVLYDQSVKDFKKMAGSIKEVRDKDGKLLYSERYVESESVPGKYKILRTDADGKEWMVGNAEYSESGTLIIEKTMTGADNTVMDYYYAESPDGGRFSYTRVTDKDGNVLLNNKQVFKKLGNNHFQSIENGVSYDIQYTGKELVITRSDGKCVELKIGDSTASTYVHENIVPLLKQLPGSALFDIAKFNLGEIGVGIHDVVSGNAHFSLNGNNVSLSHTRADNLEVFTLLHELGHMKDYKSDERIISNKELQAIFNSERSEFLKHQSKMESEAISYLISEFGGKGGLEEMVAETNAFLFANNKWGEIEQRGQYLQQYFPKTFAKIAELLQTAKPKELVAPKIDIAALEGSPLEAVPTEYSTLPEFTRGNLPENTTIMPSENLVISTVTGKPVGRLVEKN